MKIGCSYHAHIDVKGALERWRPKQWKGLLSTINGRSLTATEIKRHFIEELSKGHCLIPACRKEDCPDFDYSENGCPGHDVVGAKKEGAE
jgi:hypothetical protein